MVREKAWIKRKQEQTNKQFVTPCTLAGKYQRYREVTKTPIKFITAGYVGSLRA
jgi:hypothetical protein